MQLGCKRRQDRGWGGSEGGGGGRGRRGWSWVTDIFVNGEAITLGKYRLTVSAARLENLTDDAIAYCSSMGRNFQPFHSM